MICIILGLKIRISMLFSKTYRFLTSVLVAMTMLVIIACSSDKFVPDGQYLLDKVELRSDRKER